MASALSSRDSTVRNSEGRPRRVGPLALPEEEQLPTILAERETLGGASRTQSGCYARTPTASRRGQSPFADGPLLKESLVAQDRVDRALTLEPRSRGSFAFPRLGFHRRCWFGQAGSYSDETPADRQKRAITPLSRAECRQSWDFAEELPDPLDPAQFGRER